MSRVLPLVRGQHDDVHVDASLSEALAPTRAKMAAHVRELNETLARLDELLELARRGQPQEPMRLCS